MAWGALGHAGASLGSGSPHALLVALSGSGILQATGSSSLGAEGKMPAVRPALRPAHVSLCLQSPPPCACPVRPPAAAFYLLATSSLGVDRNPF